MSESLARAPRDKHAAWHGDLAGGDGAGARPTRVARTARVLPLGRYLVKYVTVGLSGVGVVIVVFWLLHERLALPLLPAAVLANEVAVCSNYLLNNNWTFADRRTAFATRAGLLRYHVISCSGIALNLAVLALLTGALAVPALPAQLGGILISTAWNFAINVSWTWRATRARSAWREPMAGPTPARRDGETRLSTPPTSA